MQDRIRLVLIYGSVREERFCDQVVAWAREQIEQRSEFELSLVDPAVMFRQPGEALELAERRHQSLQQLLRADAFLIVTPGTTTAIRRRSSSSSTRYRHPGKRGRWGSSVMAGCPAGCARWSNCARCWRSCMR